MPPRSLCRRSLAALAALALIGASSAARAERELRPVDPFDRIALRTIGELFIEQTAADSLRVEAEPKVLARLRTTVRNGTLTIEFEGAVRTDRPVRFYATVRTLRAIETTGSGDITISALRGDTLAVLHTGSGGVVANALDLKQLTVRAAGAGEITLAGRVDAHDAKLGGAGDYDAHRLVSRIARIEVSGAGSATVHVTAELDAIVAGSGDLRYSGGARVRRRIQDAGSIEAR